MSTEAIAVVASSVVAIAAIGAGTWDHWANRRQARELADLDNVRDVFDSAAELLHRASYALDDVRVGLTQHGGAFFNDEKSAGAYSRLEAFGQECDGLAARLEVRLGPDHEAVRSFGEVNEALLAIYRALGMIRLESDAPPEAAAQVRSIIDQERAKITQQRDEFDRSRKEFIEIASRTAGARLPSG